VRLARILALVEDLDAKERAVLLRILLAAEERN
jgi:hypothetical protein